jgi:hypothetical protein
MLVLLVYAMHVPPWTQAFAVEIGCAVYSYNVVFS